MISSYRTFLNKKILLQTPLVFREDYPPAYSLGDYFTKQIRYDDGNGVEGGVYERVDPINVRGQRRLPDPSGAYWGNRSPGSGNGSGGGEPAYGGSGVQVAVVEFPVDVRCVGSRTTSTDDDLTRELSANDTFKGWKMGPGMKVSVLFVTYADGGTELFNVVTSGGSVRLKRIPGSLKMGNGEIKKIPAENCAAG